MWFRKVKALAFAAAMLVAVGTVSAKNEVVPTEEGNVTYVMLENGEFHYSTVTECCDNLNEFETKINRSLTVLRAGYGKEKAVSKVGNYEYYDFRKGGKDVARLIYNKKLNEVMLVQHHINAK